MAKISINLKENILNRKDVNHIVRYCSKLEYIIDNITIKGFHPSYCKETFNDENLLIPMVSFCNIPLREVENYMYYGDYGIGFNIEWAIKNKISPVMYVHENSEAIKLSKNLEKDLRPLIVEGALNSSIKNIALNQNGINSNDDLFYTKNSLSEIRNNNIKIIQNLKPWKSILNFKIEIKLNDSVCDTFEDIEINSYNEREWRFVPEFEQSEFESIIKENNPNYKKYTTSEIKKPHFKNNKYKLSFELSDIKYIIVKEQNEVEKVVETLKKTFGVVDVNESMIKGKVQIVSKESLKTDY